MSISRVLRTAIVLAIATTSLALLPGAAGAVTSSQITITPSSTALGDVNLNDPSKTVALTVTNTGGTAWLFNGLSSSDPDVSLFPVTCGGMTLNTGDSCLVSAWLQPTSTGAVSASISANVTAPDTTGTVTVTANIIDPQLSVTPSELDFGTVDVNSSATHSSSFTISNPGTGLLAIDSMQFVNNDDSAFAFSGGTCPTGDFTIAGGSSCTVGIVFDPSATGDFGGNIVFNSDAWGEPGGEVSLVGEAVNQSLVNVTVSIDADQDIESGATDLGSVLFYNNGSVPVSLGAATVTGADASSFAISSNGCAGTLAVDTECTIDVTFDPAAIGSYSASLNLASGDPDSPASVTLTGTGTLSKFTANAASLAFADQAPGSPASAAKNVIYTNAGSIPESIGTFSITGPDASSFAISGSSTCPIPGALPVGGSCTEGVTFAPTTAGSKSATLHLSYFGGAKSVDVPLTGSSTTPAPPVTPVSPAPALTASLVKPAKIKKLKQLVFNVGCGAATCAVKISGKLKFKLKKGSKTLKLSGSAIGIGANGKVTIKLSSSQKSMLATAKVGTLDVKVSATAPGGTAGQAIKSKLS
jgi:hypothetical protein